MKTYILLFVYSSRLGRARRIAIAEWLARSPRFDPSTAPSERACILQNFPF
ncbi:hypothetical protein [Oxynema aestuarii]|uniref:hypothetical protein n=1 Tax=Oxynema aestuarii TaxID=2874213 RepID=UPI001B3153A8|nr:hypothetical protein [Oxynema aestuarii]